MAIPAFLSAATAGSAALVLEGEAGHPAEQRLAREHTTRMSDQELQQLVLHVAMRQCPEHDRRRRLWEKASRATECLDRLFARFVRHVISLKTCTAIVAAAGLAVLGSRAAAVAHHPGSSSTAVLALDRPRFWDGPTVVSGNVPDPSLCDSAAGACYAWPLELSAGAARLRVAIDTPMRSNTFELDLVDPQGKIAATATNGNMFDAEAYAIGPAAGIWTVRVMPQGVHNAALRLRAKLESRVPAPPPGRVAMLPNLKAVPPMELTFIAPANPANGLYPPDTINPPLDVLGAHPLACTVDESAPASVQGGAATRCLRFTSGPVNAGAGPYEMHFTYLRDLVGGEIGSPIAHGPMFQTTHYSDGTTTVRRAGTYSFHVAHFHFHDDNVLDYQLFRVLSGDHLVKAGPGTKSGFCPANQLLGDWRSFDNQPPDGSIGSGDVGTGNCESPADGVLGLSSGWGDVYRWQRPGQYVEFGDNPDGVYVVRVTIDVDNDVLETNEHDNSAYALVKVVGDTLQVLERGQGLSPYDPHKIVFRGSGPASRD